MIEVHYILDVDMLSFCLINRSSMCAYYAKVLDSDLFNAMLDDFGWKYDSDEFIFDDYVHVLLGTFASYNDFVSAHPEFFI